jgi:hypothetical protein
MGGMVEMVDGAQVCPIHHNGASGVEQAPSIANGQQ